MIWKGKYLIDRYFNNKTQVSIAKELGYISDDCIKSRKEDNREVRKEMKKTLE